MCLEIISIDGCVLQRNCKTWHVIISKDSLGDYLNLQRTSNQIRYISHQYIISIYKESAKIKSILDRSTREASHPLLRLNFISLRRKQNRRHFADDVFKCNILNENVWIPIEISLKFVPKGPINNIPALVQIMAWRRLGDKPLSKTVLFFTDAYMRHSASMS